MTDQAVRRHIDAWRSDERCTEVLTLGRLPLRQKQPTDQGAGAADQLTDQPTDQSIPSTSGTRGATGGPPNPQQVGSPQRKNRLGMP